jgi:hypothetical protein
VLTLSNKTGVDQAFKLTTVDFGSLNESGGVAFLGESSSDFAQKYGLTSWMKLERDAVTVPAGGSIDAVVTVDNSSGLRPGGHYGAVLATALTAPNGPPARSRVGVLEVLSSLILLVKDGGPTPDLRLVSQTVDKSGLKIPTQVEHRFRNAGGQHVVPRGVAEVRDPAGRLVERGALNENSGVILPQTFRRYQTPLMKVARIWLPGRYTVRTSYRYDGGTATKQLASGFWYVGAGSVWLAAAAVMLLGAAAVWWLLRRGRLWHLPGVRAWRRSG